MCSLVKLEIIRGQKMFAVCTIVKDEPEHYVREWLDWHRGIGVDRFFIYDNGGWTIEAKDIWVVPFKGLYVQTEAYNHCLQNCDGADYLALIDIDEFLMGPVLDRLPYVENALVLNWKVFGTSGLEWNPQGKQMGVFRCHFSPSNFGSWHGKSIVRPIKTIRMLNPHRGLYVDNGSAEDFNGVKKDSGWPNPIDEFSGAWINHYFTRSMSDWRNKVRRGNANSCKKNIFEAVFLIDMCCTELEGKGVVCQRLLPRIAEAKYGMFPNMVNVTDNIVEDMIKTGHISIKAGEYNKRFGDHLVGKIKRFYLRFERLGHFLAEVEVTEDESFYML